MKKPIFQFSNVVVVDGDRIGVIVKTWDNEYRRKTGYHYDVYVRSYCAVQEYQESEIKHYVYSKELAEYETDFYR